MAGYKLVSKDHIRLDDTRYRHAAHAMVYAPVREKMLGKYEYKYAVMMQCRFDGTLGFPGGIVDSGETPEASVTREFVEEVGVAVGDVVFEEKDHTVTHVSDHTHFCLHFFARSGLGHVCCYGKKSPVIKGLGPRVVNIGFGSSLLNIPFATSRLTTYNCAAATSAGSSARVPPSKLEQKNIKLEQRNRELKAIIQEMRQEMEQCVNADPAGIADGQLMVKDVLSRMSDATYSAEYISYLERELAEMKAEKRKIAERLDELVAH
eukprot:Em0014g94a